MGDERARSGKIRWPGHVVLVYGGPRVPATNGDPGFQETESHSRSGSCVRDSAPHGVQHPTSPARKPRSHDRIREPGQVVLRAPDRIPHLRRAASRSRRPRGRLPRSELRFARGGRGAFRTCVELMALRARTSRTPSKYSAETTPVPRAMASTAIGPSRSSRGFPRSITTFPCISGP